MRGPSDEHNTLPVCAVCGICHGHDIVILHLGFQPGNVLRAGQCFSELEFPFSFSAPSPLSNQEGGLASTVCTESSDDPCREVSCP